MEEACVTRPPDERHSLRFAVMTDAASTHVYQRMYTAIRIAGLVVAVIEEYSWDQTGP